MQVQEQYEIISEPNRFRILSNGTTLAQVQVYVTDDDIQHIEVLTLEQSFLKSDFDLGMTIVPGLTRHLYLYDQPVASFTLKNLFTYECKTWQENAYIFECVSNAIQVYRKSDHLLVAYMSKNIHNNHMYVTFKPECFEAMRLIIALFPCIRFN